MSIQIPFSRDDLSLRRAGNLVDLYNPQKHDLWLNPSLSREPIRAQTFRNMLRAIFSRENVNNFDEFIKPLIFFKYGPEPAAEYTDTIEFTKTILRLMPDEHLWMIPFINFNYANRNNVYVSTTIWTDYSSSSQFQYSWDERRNMFPSNLANETGPGSCINFIQDFCTRFSTYWDTHATKTIGEQPFTWYNSIELLFLMIRGKRYIFTSASRGNGDTIAPQQVKDLLDQNSAAEIKLTVGGGGNFSIQVRVPITYANRNLLYQVFQYSQDVTQMLDGPRKLKHEGIPVFIGVELELTTDYNVGQLIDATKEPFFIAKQDASISGSKPNRMELVTVPGSFKYLKQQYAMWFNNLDYQKFDCTTQTSNGMHVHVDRKAFDDDYHIRNFCWFINNPANTPFIVTMSDRGSLQAMQNYTPFLQFPYGTTRTNAFKQCHRLLDGHRGATNLKNGWARAKTVEVRIFRGIVSYAAIVKNLEFVESLFYFTQSLRSYREMSLSSYIQWLFKSPPNRYSILKKFIENLDLDKFLLAADVKDIIFNETDPDKIAQLLMKSGLTLTNDHISYLNKGRKRTFTLEKDTGVINVLKTNIFKLASLDVELAKRITRNNVAA